MSGKKIELHEVTKNLLDDTQARIFLAGNGRWTYDRILRTALLKLREELRLEETK